jgi:hypothetical protein
MTDTPKVPREWTISKYLQLIERTGGPPGNQIISFVNGPDCTDVNVIEHSAYQSAVDALEQEKICSARIFSDAGKLTKERDQSARESRGVGVCARGLRGDKRNVSRIRRRRTPGAQRLGFPSGGFYEPPAI